MSNPGTSKSANDTSSNGSTPPRENAQAERHLRPNTPFVPNATSTPTSTGLRVNETPKTREKRTSDESLLNTTRTLINDSAGATPYPAPSPTIINHESFHFAEIPPPIYAQGRSYGEASVLGDGRGSISPFWYRFHPGHSPTYESFHFAEVPPPIYAHGRSSGEPSALSGHRSLSPSLNRTRLEGARVRLFPSAGSRVSSSSRSMSHRPMFSSGSTASDFTHFGSSFNPGFTTGSDSVFMRPLLDGTFVRHPGPRLGNETFVRSRHGSAPTFSSGSAASDLNNFGYSFHPDFTTGSDSVSRSPMLNETFVRHPGSRLGNETFVRSRHGSAPTFSSGSAASDLNNFGYSFYPDFTTGSDSVFRSPLLDETFVRRPGWRHGDETFVRSRHGSTPGSTLYYTAVDDWTQGMINRIEDLEDAVVELGTRMSSYDQASGFLTQSGRSSRHSASSVPVDQVRQIVAALQEDILAMVDSVFSEIIAQVRQ